jgi:hypothetical protein
MAIIATVTKKAVTYRMPKMWNITLNMTLADDGVEVINRDYNVRYRTGDSIAAKIDEFSSMMQYDINKYKSEKAIYTAAELDIAVIDVGNALVV